MGRRLTRGQRNIAWIETYCRIPEGKDVGKPVKLRPWQKKIIRGMYDTPTRRAIISFGRKNAKTTLSAFLLLLHLCGPEYKPNSDLFSTALARDQAAILFRLAAKIVRMSPDLNAVVGIRDTAKQLYCPELGTLYRALSADAATNFGLSPVFCVHDELGQVKGPRSDLYEAIETAAGAQESPLSVIISTQAPTDADLLSVLIDDALAGSDPRTKVWIWSAPDELNPFTVKAIKAANPAYGDFLNAVEVRDSAKSAQRMPAREPSYRNLILNQRVNMLNPFVTRKLWAANGGKVSDEAFERGTVRMGLDLSARNDLTAVVAVAEYDGLKHVRAHFFAPLEGIHERAARDRVPYDVWHSQGLLTATPGASVDYETVADVLIEYCDAFDVAAIAFDRWRIDVLKSELERKGVTLPLIPHGQGFRDMSPALDALEADLLNGKIRHGMNPVLTMCAANAVIDTDPAGNRKLNKAKSTGRIDGMVSLAMCMGVVEGKAETTFWPESGVVSL